jgi:hypothetical protein
LAALLRLVLTGLAALLGLPVLAGLSALLSRLTTLLALSVLATLLAFLFHIVCHESFPPKESTGTFPHFLEFNRHYNLVAAIDCKVGTLLFVRLTQSFASTKSASSAELSAFVYTLPRRVRCVASETTNSTRKITNNNFATPAAATATPVKPNTPAMSAITRNISVQ